MAQQRFPELVTQTTHRPGFEEPRTFEDALRDLVRNSPYLGISVLLHGIVFLIMASMTREIPPPDDDKTITANQENIEEVLPPEPPPPEPEIEEIEEVIEEPVVAEEVVTDVEEVVDNLVTDLPFDNTGKNDVIGVGAGGGGSFGRGGKLGNRGQLAGKPHQKAVDDALKWLRYHQDPEGYWSCNEFDNQCGRLADANKVKSWDPCDGRGSPQHDVGVTGLALLAFLGHGDTDSTGPYRETVKNALRWLIGEQDRTTGRIGRGDHLEATYDHIIATLALTEAAAITQQFRYKKAATSAIEYMLTLRNPGGAWRYLDPSSPEMLDHPNDTSVTGWAILVLTLAKEYDLPVDEAALADAMAFIDEVTDPVTGRTGYTVRGGGPSRIQNTESIWPYEQTESMTAVGVLCRIFANPGLDDPTKDPLIKKGVDLMLALPIAWDEANTKGRIDFYYWYYATYALYQVGGASWKKWEGNIEQIVAQQKQAGDEQGSWDPQVDPWAERGGRVWATAINALTLEVYYRYDTVIGSH